MSRATGFITKTCQECGKNYKISKNISYVNREKSKYCSNRCKGKNSLTLFKKNHYPIKPFGNGSQNPNWKGGIAPKNKMIRSSIKYGLWRESVFARNNWTCQKCSRRSKKGDKVELHPHHIKNFAQWPELIFDIDNGITFCKKCHGKFHRIYGLKDNNKKQVKKFLKPLGRIVQ